MTTQIAIESNEGLLGAALMQHLKSYIQLFVSETAALQDVDIGALSNKVTQIIGVVDGDPTSEGYQAFQGLLADVGALKTDNTSNKSRLTAVEASLLAIDAAWKAEIARVEAESKDRDTALGLRIDGIQTQNAQYAATRLEKDTEHDGRLATLEAFKVTVSKLLTEEINRALTKEAELQAAINANAAEINAIKGREADYATRSNVDSTFVKFCQGAETELWSGRTKPDGLPAFTAAS